NQESLQRIVSQIVSHGYGQASYYVMDVQKTEQIEEIFKQIIHTYGGIDILINNAGYGIFAAIEQLSIEQYEHMMNTNYMGIVRCTKLVLPIMKAAGKGH